MKPVFFGWQKDVKGFPPFALYNVDLGFGVTSVSAKTLKRHGLEVPETPSYEEWERSRAIQPSVRELSFLDSVIANSRYQEIKKEENRKSEV